MKIPISISRLVRNVFSNHNTHKEETAMKKFCTKMAAASMAVILNVTPAFAQAPSASAAAPPPVTPPTATSAATATPATTLPAPKPASAFFFSTTSQGIAAYPFFVSYVTHVVGVEWAGTVDAPIKTSGTKVKDEAQRKEAAAILANIPKGAKDVLFQVSEKKMDDKSFIAWLESAHSCKFVSKNKELELETWSPGCDSGAKTLEGNVRKANAASKADPTVKSNVSYTLDAAMKYTAGNKKFALIHLAALQMPFSEWASALGLTDDLNLLVGKPACFLPKGEEARCGAITKADASGVTIGEETVPWDKILGDGPALGIGNIEVIQPGWNKGGGSGDYASQHPVSLEARFVLRRGWASQYDSAGMTGGLIAACLNVHDNLCLLGGVGMLSLSGQPTLGTEENDGTTLFAAMLGAHALLGSRAWPVAPMLEANVTLQGERPGVEGVLGIQSAEGLRKVFPVDLRLGASLGYYPTGVKPYTHLFKEVNDFNLFGVGFMAAAGYTF